MRITEEQIDRLMNEDREPDVYFCLHEIGTQHLCKPMPGMLNMFFVRLAGHKADPGTVEDTLDEDPNLPVADKDLMAIDLVIPETMMRMFVESLVASMADQQMCEMKSSGKTVSQQSFRFRIPPGMDPKDFERIVDGIIPGMPVRDEKHSLDDIEGFFKDMGWS